MHVIPRLASLEDLQPILALQEENHLTNIPEAERDGGFVTTRFTPEQLATLIERGHAFVAVNPVGGALLGYLLCGSWDFYFQWPIFRHMADRFPTLALDGRPIETRNSFQYGPVCVARDARGFGVLPALFARMRKRMAREFEMGATFINEANRRSMEAHARKLGLAVVDHFEYGGQRFATLAFPCAERVAGAQCSNE